MSPSSLGLSFSRAFALRSRGAIEVQEARSALCELDGRQEVRKARRMVVLRMNEAPSHTQHTGPTWGPRLCILTNKETALLGFLLGILVVCKFLLNRSTI